MYTGPIYGEADLADGSICPWCIANGAAHLKFEAEFTDFSGVGGWGAWDEVPLAVREEVAYRTPGFSGWQQERWWTHCSDAAAFIGLAGRQEMDAFGLQLVEDLRLDSGLEAGDWQIYYQALDKQRAPTAYLFRCLHCGRVGGYSDCP